MPNQSTTTNTSGLQNLFSQNTTQQDVNQLSQGTQQRMPWEAISPSLQTGLTGTMDLANELGNAQWGPSSTAAISSQILANNPYLASAFNNINSTAQQFQDSGDPFKAYQGALSASQSIPELARQNLGALAANSSGALTGAQNQTLDDMARRISLQNQSLYSGAGRYGSEGAAIGTGRAISEATNPLTAQYNQQNIQNALAAQQGITGASGVGLQALGMTPGLMQAAFMPGQMQQQLGATFQSMPWQTVQNQVATLGGLAPAYAPYGTTNTQGQMNTQGNTLSQGFGQGNSTGTSMQTQATPWTTFAGLGLAGLGALGGGI